jgi:phenylacetate-coenzyme A ligase PaaK-like adenylate-forming protein
MLIRAAELDADFSSVRLCMLSGEGSTREMREEMLERLRQFGAGSPRIVNRYGATEAGSFFECEEGSGWHNVTPEQVYIETIDEESGHRTGPGEPGLLVITHLSRRGTVLLRYAVGDVVAIDRDPCPRCGRTAERIIGQPARTSGAVKIKGQLVHLEGLSAVLAGIPGVLEFQIVVQKSDPSDPYSIDEIVLRVAAGRAGVGDEVVERTIAVTNVRPRIELVRPEEIRHPDENAKAKRIVDLRPPAAP